MIRQTAKIIKSQYLQNPNINILKVQDGGRLPCWKGCIVLFTGWFHRCIRRASL